MKCVRNVACLATALQTILVGTCSAASLRVSPILIDAGAATNTSITLINNELHPMTAQVRVFKWSQHDGNERLEPTDDVVASPPIVSVDPHQEYMVRLQRVSEQEPVGEEAYRIVVDELPNPNRQRNGTVAVVLRYVVPAFFFSPDASQPRLRWSITNRAGRPVITAENTGDKRMQLTNLSIKSGVRTAQVAKGLAGYVLGHAIKQWPLSVKLGSVRGGTVLANSEMGPIRAPLSN